MRNSIDTFSGSKPGQFRKRDTVARHGPGLLLLATVVTLAATSAEAPAQSASSASSSPGQSNLVSDDRLQSGKVVSLSSYFSTVSELLSEQDKTTYSTAREAIAANRASYSKQFETLIKIRPPSEVQVSHRDLLVALGEQAKAAADAVDLTPTSAPNDNANLNGYSHYLPDTGYARNDESAAGCDLKKLADTFGYQLQVLGFCGEVSTSKTYKTLGTAKEPVNQIYMLQDVAYDAASGQQRPNVDGFQYSTIYVKAGKAMTITFDNRNPEPFVFNIALYRNSSSTARVKASQLVTESSAYAGYKVHVISATLDAGVYTYVDNVHPTAMRGQLIAVP